MDKRESVFGYCSGAEVKLLARQAQGDGQRRRQLMAVALGDDAVEARRALWTLTHFSNEYVPWLEGHRRQLIDLALGAHDTTTMRLSLTILERMAWSVDDIDTGLLDFCLAGIVDQSLPVGVRSLCVKLAWLQCRHYTELAGELRQTIGLVHPADAKPGFRHTLRTIGQRLNGN